MKLNKIFKYGFLAMCLLGKAMAMENPTEKYPAPAVCSKMPTSELEDPTFRKNLELCASTHNALTDYPNLKIQFSKREDFLKECFGLDNERVIDTIKQINYSRELPILINKITFPAGSSLQDITSNDETMIVHTTIATQSLYYIITHISSDEPTISSFSFLPEGYESIGIYLKNNYVFSIARNIHGEGVKFVVYNLKTQQACHEESVKGKRPDAMFVFGTTLYGDIIDPNPVVLADGERTELLSTRTFEANLTRWLS